jgi:hypothetical protein
VRGSPPPRTRCHLARAAVVVAVVGAGLSVVAIVAGLLRGSPGA